ncbi:MAG: tRNA glutamyl-Q(34) synthetase GluQRS, partial [Clostridia bacterium]|nr:tRNA glutamyl-Q(34) synthetase GluQRS [Clostridia bacterium]
KTRSPAMRMRVPDEIFSFVDGHFGPVSENLAQDCGDYIIRRSDGLFGYQLAVVIDDALSGVSEIVRGRDILFSTPRQMHLQKTLGFSSPDYYHIPLLMDAHGRRLAKRDKDLDLTALSKAMTPEQILGMLAYSAGIIPENRPASLDELTKAFNWNNVRGDDIRLAYDPQAAD